MNRAELAPWPNAMRNGARLNIHAHKKSVFPNSNTDLAQGQSCNAVFDNYGLFVIDQKKEIIVQE